MADNKYTLYKKNGEWMGEGSGNSPKEAATKILGFGLALHQKRPSENFVFEQTDDDETYKVFHDNVELVLKKNS